MEAAAERPFCTCKGSEAASIAEEEPTGVIAG
jgi:hypothetical protein